MRTLRDHDTRIRCVVQDQAQQQQQQQQSNQFVQTIHRMLAPARLLPGDRGELADLRRQISDQNSAQCWLRRLLLTVIERGHGNSDTQIAAMQVSMLQLLQDTQRMVRQVNETRDNTALDLIAHMQLPQDMQNMVDGFCTTEWRVAQGV